MVIETGGVSLCSAKRKRMLLMLQITTIHKKRYTMKERYNTEDLYLARLKWVSSDNVDFSGPMNKETEIKYLFEKEGERYKEIFTGFEADIIEKHFNLPYAIDIMPLIEVHEDLKGTIFPRLGMLTLFNVVNKKENQEERGFQKKLESDN